MHTGQFQLSHWETATSTLFSVYCDSVFFFWGGGLLPLVCSDSNCPVVQLKPEWSSAFFFSLGWQSKHKIVIVEVLHNQKVENKTKKYTSELRPSSSSISSSVQLRSPHQRSRDAWRSSWSLRWEKHLHLWGFQLFKCITELLFLQRLTHSSALSVSSVVAPRLQHHRMCPDGSRSFSGGECSPDQSAERADGETLLSVTDSDSDLDV